MDSDNVVSERRFHFSRPLKTSLATLSSPTRGKNRLIKRSEKGGRRSSRMKRRKGKRQTERVGEGGSKKKEVSTGTKVPPPFS